MSYLRGVFFPFIKGNTSFPREATDAEVIQQDIVQLLFTTRRERVMRPLLGSDLFAAIFETNNPLLEETVKNEISITLTQFEPRIAVQDVSIVRNDNVIDVTITYVILVTKQSTSLTIPITTAQ